MSNEPKIELFSGEEVLIKTRPAWRSFWVFIFGLLLCGLGPFISEDPPLSPQAGLIFAAIFAIIIWRRWSNEYWMTSRRLLVRGGLAGKETHSLTLADMTGIEIREGISLRLVGAGHILVRSSQPDEESIILYGQLNPGGLKTRIERQAAVARGEARAEDFPTENDTVH